MGFIPPKVEVCEGFSLGGFLEEEFSAPLQSLIKVSPIRLIRHHDFSGVKVLISVKKIK